MDARIHPIRALGIPPGHARIIRNAGGRLADAIRSLIGSCETGNASTQLIAARIAVAKLIMFKSIWK